MLGLQVSYLLMSLTCPELCDGAGEGDPRDSGTLNAPEIRMLQRPLPACLLHWSLVCSAIIRPHACLILLRPSS